MSTMQDEIRSHKDFEHVLQKRWDRLLAHPSNDVEHSTVEADRRKWYQFYDTTTASKEFLMLNCITRGLDPIVNALDTNVDRI